MQVSGKDLKVKESKIKVTENDLDSVVQRLIDLADIDH